MIRNPENKKSLSGFFINKSIQRLLIKPKLSLNRNLVYLFLIKVYQNFQNKVQVDTTFELDRKKNKKKLPKEIFPNLLTL